MPLIHDDKVLLDQLTRPGWRIDTSDVALIALVRRCQGGDTAAGEQLLSVMAFRLGQLCRSSHQIRMAHLVSAAWFVISGYNCDRSSKVLTNLVLDCLKQVTRDRVERWDERRDQYTQPDELPWVEAGREHEAEVRALLQQARETRVLDPATSEALEAVYAQGLSSREAGEQLRQSPEMVRYRCSRGVRKLREHRDSLADLIS